MIRDKDWESAFLPSFRQILGKKPSRFVIEPNFFQPEIAGDKESDFLQNLVNFRPDNVDIGRTSAIDSAENKGSASADYEGSMFHLFLKIVVQQTECFADIYGSHITY